jgi:hypothetical protein
MSGELKGLVEPTLVLTPPAEATPDHDGLLTASKIATLKLNGDWVVLAPCNTAAGDGTPDAGGMSGLATACFDAGARQLAAGLALAGAVQGDRYIDHRHLPNWPRTRRLPREALRR